MQEISTIVILQLELNTLFGVGVGGINNSKQNHLPQKVKRFAIFPYNIYIWTLLFFLKETSIILTKTFLL